MSSLSAEKLAQKVAKLEADRAKHWKSASELTIKIRTARAEHRNAERAEKGETAGRGRRVAKKTSAPAE